MSEYANLIDSRADAIIQQLKHGVNRQNLPLSVLLRDSGSTAFQSLLAWQEAGGMLPEDYCGTGGNFLICRKDATDRVRGIELLFADYNWSNINSVYASGRGDVGMVFVKDDIGNWDLKSFDNDPAELVQAYSDVAKASLKVALQAATAPGGAQAAQAALQAATQVIGGNSGTTGSAATSQIAQLRKFTTQQLGELKKRTESDENALNLKIESLKTQTESASQRVRGNKDFKEVELEKEKKANNIVGTTSLNRFQQAIKAQQIADSAKSIAKQINNDELQAEIQQEADKSIEPLAEDDAALQDDTSAQIEKIDTAIAKSFDALVKAKYLLAKQNLDETEKQLKGFPATTLKRTQKILQDYETTLKALQHSVIPSDQQASIAGGTANAQNINTGVLKQGGLTMP